MPDHILFFLMEKYMIVYTSAIESMTCVCLGVGGGAFRFHIPDCCKDKHFIRMNVISYQQNTYSNTMTNKSQFIIIRITLHGGLSLRYFLLLINYFHFNR